MTTRETRERNENISQGEISDGLYHFRGIIGHQGPLDSKHPNWKKSKYNILVEWETGEKTYEPLLAFIKDDPVTCAQYAKANDLLHLDEWKKLRTLARRAKVLSRAILQSKLRQARRSNKYMFGYLIPKSYKEAMEFDAQNGNSKWYDANKDEMDCIHDQKVFIVYQKAKWDKYHRKLTNPPPSYHKIRVHLIFAVKYDGRHKVRLVADGHLSPDPVENVYSGVVSLRQLRLVIFLAELNGLLLWGADIGNAYFEAPKRNYLL